MAQHSIYSESSKLLDFTYNFFQKYWKLLWPISLLMFISEEITTFYTAGLTAQKEVDLTFLVLKLFEIFCSTACSIALFIQVNACLHDNWVSYTTALRQGFQKIPKVIIASLFAGFIILTLTLVAILAMYIPVNVVNLLVAAIAMTILLILMFRFIYITPTIILKDLSILQSFRYCLHLTKAKNNFLIAFLVLAIAPVIFLTMVSIPVIVAMLPLPIVELSNLLLTVNAEKGKIIAEFISNYSLYLSLVKVVIFSLFFPIIIAGIIVSYNYLCETVHSSKAHDVVVSI